MRGFALAAVLLFAVPAAAAPQIALTFDDLPAHSVLPPGVTRVDIAESAIAALRSAHVPPVTGFANAALTANEPDSAPVLKLWHDAGFLLANHTWSHMNLNDNSIGDYEAEIIHNEAVLERVSEGRDWHWFRYPYLAEGLSTEKRVAIRSFLAGRGYRIAPATMMFGDWLYSEPYARCLAKGDEAAVAALEKDYFAAATESIGYYRAMSQKLYGRDIAYVLLLHIGAFEARTLPRLIALYRDAGFEFVSLEEAERDPYYKAYADPSLAAPPQGLEQAMAERGLAPVPPPRDYAPELDKMCR